MSKQSVEFDTDSSVDIACNHQMLVRSMLNNVMLAKGAKLTYNHKVNSILG